ncbi:MAG: DUF3137 domain-containing protein [Litorimonas sp.]
MSGFGSNGTVDLQDLRVKLYDLLGHRYSAVSPSPGALMLLQTANMLQSPNGLFRCRGRIRGVSFNSKRFSVQEVCANIGDYDAEAGFDGLILSLSHALPIYGRTVVLPDRGDQNPRHIDGMKRVTFPTRTFDAKLDVYADDQAEGRLLIRPSFIQRFVDLSAALSAGHASVAFVGRQMHVVLPTGGSTRFSGDLTFYKHDAAADHIAGEIGRIFDVISRVDALHASADRHYSAERGKARESYYRMKSQSVTPMIKAAMKAGIVTDSRRAKYLTHEAAMIDPALHGLMIPSA